MGVLDKLKNALFEVEYVEVEEPPKKEKKEKKEKEKKKSKVKTEKSNKPIAKKIVLPGKEEKVEEIHEEELKDDDFEIRPKDETIKNSLEDNFKFMDDNDFEMEDDSYDVEGPKVLDVIDNTFEKKEVKKEIEEKPIKKKVEEVHNPEVVDDKHFDDYYQHENVKNGSKLYGIDNSHSISVPKYGTYEKKEDKSYFRPSPIISPIYGVLDKNYKKEDVKDKKEVRLTSYTKGNLSVDDIRNKAYGRRINRVPDVVEEEEVKFDIEDDDNVLVDLSDKSKPEVKELTVGDALEYFQDLGLEYNVDYVDVSKDKKNDEKVKVKEDTEEDKQVVKTEVVVVDDAKTINSTTLTEKTDDSISDTSDNDDSGDNDNLFDLIDSMYQEND